MSDQARPNDNRPLRVQLELHLNSDPVSGCLRSDWGRDEWFEGWLGFVEALRRMSEAHPNERS
jgi:hypothetical protein